MMIERITDMTTVMECLPLEMEIQRKGRDNSDTKKVLLFIEGQLQNPFFGFWVALDKEEVKGYCIAMLSFLPGAERLHLLRIYAKTKDLREEFESILTEWAKTYKIKIAHMTMVKHIKAMKRYGFKVVSVNMERRL